MTTIPPEAPVRVRLAAWMGPEVVAGILFAVVVVAGMAIGLTGRTGSGAAPPTSQPSAAAVASSAPPAASSAPPAATATPFEPNAAARSLTEIADRMLARRAELEGELAARRTDAVAVAELLRNINAAIVLQNGPLAELAASFATRDLATRIQAMNQATMEAIARTRRASYRNVAAYRDGGLEVITLLGPLPGIRAELARLWDVQTPSPAATARPSALSTATATSP